MNLTEQQRMDLINAGWTPPEVTRAKVLKWAITGDECTTSFDKKRKRYPEEFVTILVNDDGVKREYTYTAEEYNAALERYRA